MFKKISALLFAVITFFTGTIMPQTANIIDTLTSAVFGVPFTADAMESDFLDEIGDDDIAFTQRDSSIGFVNNMVMVFLDDDITFREKYTFVAKSGGFLAGWASAENLYILKFISLNVNKIEQKCEELMRLDKVECALPCLAHRYEPAGTPNDPFDGMSVWYEAVPNGSNWWLEAINAREAWDYSYYCSDIKVGVIDSGFQVDHPDLQGKITFPSEKYETANRPDDHGTHVAGIIAAAKDNNVGIAGVCPNAQLICVDWLPDVAQVWLPNIKIIFGVIDAVKAGAKVVNLSLGSSSSIGAEKSERLALFNWWDAKVYSLIMASLLSDGYDFLVVQSAGNGNIEGHAVDASQNGSFCAITGSSVTVGPFAGVSAADIMDRIIIVAAAENDGDGTFQLTPYSNVGSVVELAAPGAEIYSCYAESDWGFLSGTSMSAPVVTGIAALVWSVNPLFTGKEVKGIVTASGAAGRLAKARSDYFFEGLNYASVEMVNAKYAVEEAIARVYDVGKINVAVCDADGMPLAKYAAVTHSDGTVTTHTAINNGQMTFVAPVDVKALNIYDASDTLLYTLGDIAVSKGETTDLGTIII